MICAYCSNDQDLCACCRSLSSDLDRISELEARVQTLRDALEQVIKITWLQVPHRKPYCIVCYPHDIYGHLPQCFIGKALAATRSSDPEPKP